MPDDTQPDQPRQQLHDLPLRTAVYRGDGAVELIVTDGRRFLLDQAGIRSVLMEVSARAPRLYDNPHGTTTGNRAARPAPAPAQDEFRGCASLRGMREELARRGVAVPPLYGLSSLQALLDCAGADPSALPPSGWRLQCRECREVDGFHDPGCQARPWPVPVRIEDMDRRTPGASGVPGLLGELADAGLTPTGRFPSGPPEPQDLPAAVPGTLGRPGRDPRGEYCPDSGLCHHGCAPQSCFRVHHAGPLSVAGYPDNRWPDEIKNAYADGGNY